MAVFILTTGNVVYSGETYYQSKTWTGQDDPLKKSQENPYSMSFKREDYNVFGIYTDGYCSPWTSFGRFQPTPSYYFANTELARFKALERLVEKVRGHSFDLGNYIPEGRQTVEGASNILARLARGFTAIRKKDGALFVEAIGNPKTKKNLGRARKTLTTKSIAAQHLELVYGLQPLFEDVYESATAYEAISNRPRKFTITSSATHKIEKFWDSNLSGYSFYGKGRTSVRHKAIISEMNPIRSLGLLDPRGMIWEGLPFSFVVDWFIPIGQYLDLLSAIPYLEGTVTTSVFAKSETNLTKYRTATCRGSGWHPNLGAAPYSRGKMIQLTRTVGSASSLEIPPPEFKTLEKAMSPAHIWNGIALARSLLPF